MHRRHLRADVRMRLHGDGLVGVISREILVHLLDAEGTTFL